MPQTFKKRGLSDAPVCYCPRLVAHLHGVMQSLPQRGTGDRIAAALAQVAPGLLQEDPAQRLGAAAVRKAVSEARRAVSPTPSAYATVGEVGESKGCLIAATTTVTNATAAGGVARGDTVAPAQVAGLQRQCAANASDDSDGDLTEEEYEEDEALEDVVEVHVAHEAAGKGGHLLSTVRVRVRESSRPPPRLQCSCVCAYAHAATGSAARVAHSTACSSVPVVNPPQLPQGPEATTLHRVPSGCGGPLRRSRSTTSTARALWTGRSCAFSPPS